ncbi:D-alanyl-D-alanine carboxypeptidase/D-alanyl-D-alanine-endopeptidase [uncultured Metabacillus sp.]|uniref:D-alanyl-D-alanine carboxypeptidase/D-alanyl-D-alanine endopeptidase n=1 Tax=uncultured Metabacillus sp. TaxID=2860135 RepID=UPI00261C8DC8|nr:D-alanyl-D-alanine carboxypeptidase/D-alanyl-D-alanine-endopeptidase [uncultured Metabacillus sp.]
MAKLIICLLFCLVSTLFSTSIHHISANNWTTDLKSQLNKLLNYHPILQGTLAGVSIRSSSNGELLYSYNGDLRLTPASNRKLFNAAAALETLGKDYQFHTEFLTDGSINWKVLVGNLYVRGKGDPTLLPEDFDRLAQELKKKGVKIIQGDLIGDDSWYDDIRYSIDVPWSDETFYYGAQISALTIAPDKEYNPGTVNIEIIPHNKTNNKAMINVHPQTRIVKIINKTNTVSDKGENTISICREHGSNIITVKGTIPINTPIQKESIAVWEPTLHAVQWLKHSLKKQGIRLVGDEKVGVTPDKAKLILSHRSMPLSELLIPFMKLSNNSHGEILIKEMGKVFKNNGSWEAGLEVERLALAELGVNTSNIEFRDGSGISHLNLTSANELSNLLYQVKKREWFPIFLNSLPIAGSKEKMIGGTLRKRMTSPPLNKHVIAKTGTLTNVTSLCGYVQTKKGETVIFSILMNHLHNEAEGKLVEEEIVKLIANGDF